MPPEGVRKCVISTNVAETSVTLDGVRFVIDSGTVKEAGFDAEQSLRSLSPHWVSRASADQRKGRAGRTGPGVCFRLYSQAEYDALDAFTPPALLRTPLEAVALLLLRLGAGSLRNFSFVQPPPPVQVEAAVASLRALGALDAQEALTPLGNTLTQLPLELPLAKLLVLGTLYLLLTMALLTVALLTVAPLTVATLIAATLTMP